MTESQENTENMTKFGTTWKCLFSPKLYRIYRHRQENIQYEMSGLERYGDHIVTTINFMWNLGLYTSPILILYLYRRNYFAADGLFLLLKFTTSIGAIFAMSLYIRGWGRSHQPVYVRFLKTLENCQKSMTLDNKRELQKYDFDFYAWPVEYRANDTNSSLSKTLAIDSYHQPLGIKRLLMFPLDIIAYIAIHTFGIRLIYPGSIGIIQSLLASNLLQGRGRLIEAFNGQRFKLETRDKNHIDAMFIDNRKTTPTGRVLFICTEGNAGFYEIGIMSTPIDAGYSVLGWNHPGFAGSTGRPYPTQEKNAMDVVVQFAIDKLGFEVENIVLYGWSIGGYSTCWASVAYPDVRAVILDASFDDILPLAEQHMPKSLGLIVKIAIRKFVNLNNIDYLKQYPGPVLFVRRTEDEVICTEEQNLSTNRGNFLVAKLLKHRYPLIYGDEQMAIFNGFLSVTGTEQDLYCAKYGLTDDDDECEVLLGSYIAQHSKSFPMQIGSNDMDTTTKNKLALYLGRKYLKDYKSSHCTPLPIEFIELWDLPSS